MHPPSRRTALLQALFVTLLLSSSWVLIKVGLEVIPALTFAGLRYVLATLLLLPFALRGGLLGTLRALNARERLELVALGIVLYTLRQGAQFVALSLLPTATVSLVLSFTPVLVAGLATTTLREPLTRGQWLGVGLATAGALAYFGGAAWPDGRWAGLAVAVVGLVANALAAVLGRAVAGRGEHGARLRPAEPFAARPERDRGERREQHHAGADRAARAASAARTDHHERLGGDRAGGGLNPCGAGATWRRQARRPGGAAARRPRTPADVTLRSRPVPSAWVSARTTAAAALR